MNPVDLNTLISIVLLLKLIYFILKTHIAITTATPKIEKKIVNEKFKKVVIFKLFMIVIFYIL